MLCNGQIFRVLISPDVARVFTLSYGSRPTVQLLNAEGFTNAATGELPPFSTQMSYYYCIAA